MSPELHGVGGSQLVRAISGEDVTGHAVLVDRGGLVSWIDGPGHFAEFVKIFVQVVGQFGLAEVVLDAVGVGPGGVRCLSSSWAPGLLRPDVVLIGASCRGGTAWCVRGRACPRGWGRRARSSLIAASSEGR